MTINAINITTDNVNDRILEINKILDETVALLEKYREEDKPGSEPYNIDVQIEFWIFDGQWMGQFYPSVLKFPAGCMILRRGISGENLDDILTTLKEKAEKQLENLKDRTVDSIE